ncbi:hypothetical protein GDO81_015924 [Engystomops pustulosus]|uniref:Telomere repeats-binding bouquet formation protein 1 n=1 Tax=Engystomops pustulosus TaxID=76066 RepID=A0AAV7AWA6_ENGPU|nr:hypothetical protein GDO81_015924 [Engystomops pustulosus]
MKTDLKLLLECLKFQMDKPGCQKETLAAVRSICQDNIEACDYFREIGGLTFLNNLSKSSSHSILKEASLYTLAVLAESNVYCQQTLCTSALFEDVHTILSDEQSSINLKRMCVYIFLVLVSNNSKINKYSFDLLCNIDFLYNISSILRSKMLTCNMVLAGGSTNPQYQLWSSVCSALCACVNNPQNEENQKLCSTAFPQASERLRGSLHHEIARPICSLIGLTVANSRFAQDYFASIGGLNILSDVLSDLVNGLQVKSCDSKLAIVVTKTLDACIAENSKSVHHLSKHNILSSLMNLLSCATLEPEDKFSIVLTVGHLTDDCEANQYELLKSNGLPLMIQVLAESQDDELHKAATYVLQNCRCITETLSLDLNKHNPNLSSATSDNNQRGKYLDEYWGKAAEIFHKIQYLQQQYNEVWMEIDPMMICADLIHKEINKVVDIHCTLRCSGCLVAGYAMTSRNCSNILMGCPHLCDRHRVILQAEERFRSEYRKLLYGTGSITKGTRKDFTQIEIAYLLDGVEKFGHHWNAILWSYPFQKGRRNVDLAKKYKHLEGQH